MLARSARGRTRRPPGRGLRRWRSSWRPTPSARPSSPASCWTAARRRSTGTLIACIAALFLALLAWLAWAQVDEVVYAAGTVEPAGRVKIVNHPRGGRVAAIHVREGEAGRGRRSSWSRLDGEVARSERSELLGRLQLRKVEVARLEAEASGRELAWASADYRPDLLAAQQALLEARNAAQTSRREALAKAMQARRGEMRTAAAEVERLRNSLELLKQQREAVRELADRGLYPELKVVQVERQYSDDLGELAKAKASLDAAEAALAEAAQPARGPGDRAAIRGAGAAGAGDGRARPPGRAAARAGRDPGRASRSRRPPPGIVQEIVVTAPGQAVAAHETLMKLVPAERGPGRPGQGRQPGRRPAAPGHAGHGQGARLRLSALRHARRRAAEGRRRRHARPAHRRAHLRGHRRHRPRPSRRGRRASSTWRPGMVVDVDLKIGERTILSYLTDRIFRLQEAFREG